jgi:hypothetical protein
MVSPVSVAGEFTAETAEFAEVFLEFSAVLAGSAVHIGCDWVDNTSQDDCRGLKVRVKM